MGTAPTMGWIDILWPTMAGATVTLGGIHLSIWLRQRDQPAHLALALAAALVGICAIFELQMMRATSAAQYADLLRWAHLPVALLVVALNAFVLLHFRPAHRWLGLAACALRVACLPANFLTGDNLNFQATTSLLQVGVWGGSRVGVPVGEPNPWMLVAQLSNVLMVVFLVDTVASTWRRADRAERRRVLLVCGSMALFMMAASIWTALVVLGWVTGPLTVNIAFVFVIVAMGHEMGGNVIRAAQLGRQLFDSEANLRASEQRMQLAASAAGLGLWSWDLRDGTSWLTDSGNQLLGLVPGGSGSPVHRDIALAQVHPDDRDAILAARDEAIRGGGDYACEFRLPQPAGTMRWLAVRGRVEYAASGEPLLLRGVIHDVTERREADARFRQVIDSAPVAMLLVDGDERITLANPQAERVFGHAIDDMVGQRIQLLLPDPSRTAQTGDTAHFAAPADLSTNGAARELFGIRSDGGLAAVSVGLTPIRIGDDLYMLASVTDISERLRLEQESALQRDELAHLSRVTLLGEMSGSLAHELNQPLTAVLSNAQAALRFLDHQPPALGEIRDCLLHVVASDKRASEVIRRLRAMLRKEPVDYQSLSINAVVQDVLALINSDVLNRNVVLTLDLDPGLPEISGDRVQLQQVLLNLIINGCDAMDDMRDGKTLVVRTRPSDAPAPGVHVSVSDVGHGIAADEVEHIFTPFVSTKADGIGLGLPICRTLIQAHRGSLWATSSSGAGATLHFVLPATQQANAPSDGGP